MLSPEVTVTEVALRAFRDAATDSADGEVLRLTIDAKFQNDLYFGAPQPNDVIVDVGGLRLAMDPRTARRANGLQIDFVAGGATGPGFKLDNPNQSSRIKSVCPADVVSMLEKRERFQLIDARSADERKRAKVKAARLLDAAYEAELERLPKSTRLVFMGHHSTGGRETAQRFHDRGFIDVWYVMGGIDAWSTMDPDVPRY